MLFDCVFHIWLRATFCLHELLTFVLPERLSQSQVVHRTLFWILGFRPVAASFSMTLEISPFSQKEIVMKLLVKSATSWTEPTVLLQVQAEQFFAGPAVY